MKFADNTPDIECDGQWQLMKDARESSGDVAEFDRQLRSRFTMVCDDPEKRYPTIKEAWDTFLGYFDTVSQIVTYKPVWEQYFYDALQMFDDNNVMYVEVRSLLPKLYELDGTEHDQVTTALTYKKALYRYLKNNPDFVGAKMIYAPSRKVDDKELDEYLATDRDIKENVPELFAGFDLTGQEDAGEPLIDFIPQLKDAENDMDYYFHAGETDWYGSSTDDNLIDAVLLGAKRIGHGYSLGKHPLLEEEVKKRDIGLEVNLIPNNVLELLKDIRNHPLAEYIARNMPVVISSDDPGIWEADPLSHDFYVAFVAVAGNFCDLRLLKTLALNSFKYSALYDSERDNALQKFNEGWNDFIYNFDCSKYQSFEHKN